MVRWLLPFLWYALIFATSSTVISRDAFVSTVGSALPGAALRDGFSNLWLVAGLLFVKLWHATEFAILFLLFRRASRREGFALALTLIAAASDEFHQTFVPGRGGLVTDVLIDFAGAVTALLILRKLKPCTSDPQLPKTSLPSAN